MMRQAVVSRLGPMHNAQRVFETTAIQAATLVNRFPRLLREERGQSFGEYALILVLVVIVVAVAVSPFGGGLAAAMSNTFADVVALL